MARMEQDLCVEQMGHTLHLSHLSSRLNRLRHQAAFCDVTIVVGGQRFPAHKAVLSCASDYFQAMFSSGFQESTMGEITVPGTEESFAQILDFAYTGTFTLSARTVVGILKMACYMVLTKAVKLCAVYLKDVKDKLRVEDCFEIWSIACNHNSLSDVAHIYRSHVIQNFVNCVKSDVFLENSSASVMLEILSAEEIETETLTEEQILQGAVMWLKYDWEQRKVHAVDLLKKIRLGLVPVDRLHEILGDELLAVPECKDMVENVVKLSDIMDLASPDQLMMYPDLFATRNTISEILTVNKDVEDLKSGIVMRCATKTSCYNLTNFPDFPSTFRYQESDLLMNYAGLLVSDAGHLYAGGGKAFSMTNATTTARLKSHYQSLSENNFFRYNSERNEWDVLPPMLKIRHSPVMIQVDECIYAFGFAENKLDSISIMEKYSFPRNKWEIVRDTIGFTAQNVVEVNGNLLVKGLLTIKFGYQVRRIVKVALYKPAKDEWVNVSTDVGVDKHSQLEAVDDICYIRYFCKNKPGYDDSCAMTQEYDVVKRVLCDFESDRPSLMIAWTVWRGSHLYNEITAAANAVREFAFDKRKLGMVPVTCGCNFHKKMK